MIKGRDSSFELQKFAVVSKTGERREQLGLAGVQVGEVITFLNFSDTDYQTKWVVESEPVADDQGILTITASDVK